jgi:hypothetical protein
MFAGISWVVWGVEHEERRILSPEDSGLMTRVEASRCELYLTLSCRLASDGITFTVRQFMLSHFHELTECILAILMYTGSYF